MKLKLKVIVIIAAALGVFLVITAAVFLLVVMPSFETLEAEQIHRRHQRANSAFAREIAAMAATTGDWAHWVDSYQFVRGEYPEFPDENLHEENVRILDLDAMLYFAFDGSLFYGQAIGFGGTADDPAMRDLDERLRENDWLAGRIASHGSGSGAGEIGGKPAFIAVEPITDGARNTITAGTMVLVRYLDDEMIEEFRELLQINLAVMPLDGSVLPMEADKCYRTLVSGASGDMATITDRNEYRSYFLARDPDGRPAWLVVQSAGRDVTQRGRWSVYLSLATLVGFSVLILMIMAFSIDRYMLRRIRRLAGELIGARKDPRTVITIEDSDEITSLEKEVANSLSALSRSLAASRSAEQVANAQAAATAAASRALEEKVAELERFRSLTVDRELKMVELKRRIQAADKETGI